MRAALLGEAVQPTHSMSTCCHLAQRSRQLPAFHMQLCPEAQRCHQRQQQRRDGCTQPPLLNTALKVAAQLRHQVSHRCSSDANNSAYTSGMHAMRKSGVQ